MPFGYTAAHCEWLPKYAYTNEVSRPPTFEVLLYDDQIDELGFHADLIDITSEPETGNYQRATLSFPGDCQTKTDERGTAVHPIGATFDFQNVTESVDSIGIAWRAELDGDASPTNHLMIREQLDEREDLEERKNEYTVEPNWRLEPLY